MNKSLIITDVDEQAQKPCDHLHKLVDGIDNNNDIEIKQISSKLLDDEIAVAFMYNNNTYIVVYNDTNNPLLNINDLNNKSSDLIILQLNTTGSITNL